MSDIRMGEAESRFAEIIWNNEPLSSGRLAKLAEGELNWKKTTSFTVLKRLCDRGIFQNNGGTVTSKLSREEYFAQLVFSFRKKPDVIGLFKALLVRNEVTPDIAVILREML